MPQVSSACLRNSGGCTWLVYYAIERVRRPSGASLDASAGKNQADRAKTQSDLVEYRAGHEFPGFSDVWATSAPQKLRPHFAAISFHTVCRIYTPLERGACTVGYGLPAGGISSLASSGKSWRNPAPGEIARRNDVQLPAIGSGCASARGSNSSVQPSVPSGYQATLAKPIDRMRLAAFHDIQQSRRQ